ncbi:hypothetical protein FXF51_41605 [Nonomuraea sp. PA05]|uniref:hypothetical protein n=1 Tax=Nonomuraea sp. PA05 TaxID=2604466 RepID=UPI0011D7F066|nr:hypothetical protein [Nonomuraea sp. PA05]TYB56983.1 hypothetical protein FXF51_41605 [Nonomuraea sp. PA05]
MPHSHRPLENSEFQDLASVLLPLNREIARTAALQAGAAAQRARAAAQRAQQARERARHIAERLAQVRRRLRG